MKDASERVCVLLTYMFMRQTAILIDIGMWHEGMINKISCCFSYLHLCYLLLFCLSHIPYGLMCEIYAVRNDITINCTLITHFVIAFAAVFLPWLSVTFTWINLYRLVLALLSIFWADVIHVMQKLIIFSCDEYWWN